MHHPGASQRAGVRGGEVPLLGAMRLSIRAISLNLRGMETRRVRLTPSLVNAPGRSVHPSGEKRDAENPQQIRWPGLASLF